MKLIYETDNFKVEAVGPDPHITRTDGGHIKITPKFRFVDRTELPPEIAIEFMRLSMVVGKAMAIAMNDQGIDIGRINYQDNGNWSVFTPEGPYFHLHLYGRAKSAKVQKYGDATHFPHRETGFYKGNEELTDEDVAAIRKQIDLIFKEEKYQDKNWHL